MLAEHSSKTETGGSAKCLEDTAGYLHPTSKTIRRGTMELSSRGIAVFYKSSEVPLFLQGHLLNSRVHFVF